MPSVDIHSANGRLPAIPQAISRSSSTSISVVSPLVRDGVEEIATRLGEVNCVIKDLNSTEIGQVFGIEVLLKDVSELQAEVTDLKLAQNDKFEEIRNGIRDNTMEEIAKMLKGDIDTMIAGSVAEHVEKEMAIWATESDTENLSMELECAIEANNAILEDGKTQLENSQSRYANSTFDILDDFNKSLTPLKRHDGCVSELFPASLRLLFAYSSTKLLRLLEEYNLHALDRPAENLNRFLIFIGINACIPEQLVDALEEEHPPAYPHGSIPCSLRESDRKSSRRYSSASEKSSNAFVWSSIFG